MLQSLEQIDMVRRRLADWQEGIHPVHLPLSWYSAVPSCVWDNTLTASAEHCGHTGPYSLGQELKNVVVGQVLLGRRCSCKAQGEHWGQASRDAVQAIQKPAGSS